MTASDRPNVVFVCSDQHSYRYTGYEGHPYVRTPNMDHLAEEGVVFENAYCASPVCTPSRASLLTGVYPSDVDSFCNSTVWDGSHPTWGTRLREAGYRTWSTGKFDLDPAHDIGFEAVEPVSHGHASSPDVTSLFRRPTCYRTDERPMVDGEPRENRHEFDADCTANAEAFLREEAPDEDEPWAAWVGFTQPHPPFTALEEHFERYYPSRVEPPNVPPEHLEGQHPVVQQLRRFKRVDTPIPEDRIRRARAGYYGMIAELDEYVGRLREALEDAGEYDDTVFVYTSDHGEMLGEQGLWFKNTLYEDAVRVPMIVAGPGLPEGETVDAPVGHVDLIHTLLEWAGATLPQPGRGRSLAPLVEGEDESDWPGYAYAENHSEGNATGSFMIRKGDWKYVRFTWYDDRLFDLSADPNEFENRIDDPEAADVREELRAILRDEVDPEAVTRRAFERQEEILAIMADELGTEGFFEELRGRLGDGQARALAEKHARK